MAIVRSSSRFSRGDDDGDGEASSSEEDELQSASPEASSSEEEDDHRMALDELDISDIGEPGAELCQVGNQSCIIPLELYGLPDLTGILSVDTWNNCLSEEDRFTLAGFLPDMDQEMFVLTLRELFSGVNFHFGSPLSELFGRLNSGMCDPRTVLYRRGMSFFRQREHYHRLCRYQNSMVGRLVRIRSAWEKFEGYGIEERLRLLNIMRSQRDLWCGRDGNVRMETDSESSGEQFWNKRLEMAGCALPPLKIGKESKKGLLKVVGPPKAKATKLHVKAATQNHLSAKEHGRYACSPPQQDEVAGFDSRNGRHSRNRMAVDYQDYDDREYEDLNASQMSPVARSGPKQGMENESAKRYKREVIARFNEEEPGGYGRFSHYYNRTRSPDQELTVASYDHRSLKAPKKSRHSHKDHMCSRTDRLQQQPLKGAKVDWSEDSQPLNFAEFKSSKGKTSTDSKAKSHKIFFVQVGNSHFHSDCRTSEKLTGKSAQKGMAMEYSRGLPLFAQSEETEPGLSDHAERNGDVNPWTREMVYPSGATDGHQTFAKSAYDSRKVKKFTKTDNYDGDTGIYATELETYSVKGNRKGKANECSYIHDVKSIKKQQIAPPLSEKLQQPSLMNSYNKERKRKAIIDLNYLRQQSNSMPDFDIGVLTEDEEDLDWNPRLDDAQMQSGRSINRHQVFESNAAVTGSLVVESSRLRVSEKRTTDTGQGRKTQKKPLSLITPSIHTGFSFSIVHLFSAVRRAMITHHREDAIGIGNHHRKDDRRMKMRREEMLQAVSGDDMNANTLGLNLPSLTVQEIVNRVRTNPSDPCILETQEPLQDLIRGVLKILASKSAPLGAKGWKVLVFYEKLNKSWTWVGPVSSSSSDSDAAEEDTSAEAWGIPHKMLVKLVDAFANWLKGGQETLQQIGSLPAPPIMMLPNLDEKERFKDLRAQKSLNTFSPSSDEMRAYFHTEEHLRYLVPDRAFSYTAYDGKKSIVAPLRRGGGKPTSKARDHFMLKPDRPAHVTILCLVRDAAARLPGSIGTRADVSTLIRDSQYVVEDVSDAQVNGVVSGALDRLHYERDPCVQYVVERKLWVYLHSNREEEDFEDDGTSSTKKWKRQRRDPTEPSDIGTGNDVSYNGIGNPVVDSLSAGYELSPELNNDSSSVHVREQAELICNGLRTNTENIQSYIELTEGGRSQWESLGLYSSRETKILCRQNSTNEVFDDEPFCRKRP